MIEIEYLHFVANGDDFIERRFRSSLPWPKNGRLYAVTVERSKLGHMIVAEDTRKKLYGRVALKHEHPLDEHMEIVDNGPAAVSLTMLSLVIEGKVPLG
ncbi:hypothetical protein HJB89_25275 [Rhizobium sp. NZLR8]|uniref:hypothetical protein n=1 Tax=Rhizobium sp. NZLR8 TaxID=2731104 RepID=UPI001C835FDD|nr:hypothetical protein [Rhizobium sp. NZLR8]MBX5160399.1 hypothetical protein [Rhizobium sp. NZLR8]